MAYENDSDWGERWVCSLQSAHIMADPSFWSVDTIALDHDAVDIDGEPLDSCITPADMLTPEQLRICLGVYA